MDSAEEQQGTVVLPPEEDPQQQEMRQRAQEFEQTLLRNFQMEIGRAAGQAVVDRTNFEAKERDWERERERYQQIIQQLSDRIANLESSFPATEPGDPPSDAAVLPFEEAAPLDGEAAPANGSRKASKVR